MAFDIFDIDPIVTGGVAFSGGNLTATCSAGSLFASRNAQTKEGKTAGKWYVEFTCGGISGNVDGVGVVSSLGLGGVGFLGDSQAGVSHDLGWGYFANNHVANQGNTQTSVNNTTWGSGDVIGLAIDLDNKRLWLRLNGGAWVGTSGTPDPATNTSGFDISDMLARSQRVYPIVNMSGSGAIFTANFGATSFTGAVPSGFTSGWTNTGAAYFGSFATNGFGSYTDTPPQNNVAVSKYTSNFTGKLDNFVIPFASNATSDLKGVVYSDNAGVPDTLLGVSPAVNTGASGEVTLDFSGLSVNLVSGTAYWFGVISDASAGLGTNRAEIAGTSAAGIYFVADSYASPSSTFPGSPSTVNLRYPILIYRQDTDFTDSVTEAASASEDATYPLDLTDSVTESATASDEGSFPVAYDEFDVGDAFVAPRGVFSNGNLTFAGTTGTSPAYGNGSPALAQTREGKSAEKWYVEFTIQGGAFNNVGAVGIAPVVGLGSGFGLGINASPSGLGYFPSNGKVFADSAEFDVGDTYAPGDVVSIAIDLDNGTAWVRKNGNNWCGTLGPNGVADPETNTQGFDISASLACGRVYPAVQFVDTNAQITANFGASAFSHSVPSGFHPGWSYTSSDYFGSLWVDEVNLNGALPNAGVNVGVWEYSPAVDCQLNSIVGVCSASAASTPSRMLVFDDTGTQITDGPGALLGFSDSLSALVKGENLYTFSTPVGLSAGTKYWIGVLADLSASNAYHAVNNQRTNGSVHKTETSFSSPASPFGSTTGVANQRVPILMLITPTEDSVTESANATDVYSGPAPSSSGSNVVIIIMG